MNKERVLQVADAIENYSVPDLGFDMRDYYSPGGESDAFGHDCKTTACIAGYVVILFEPEKISRSSPNDLNYELVASRILDIESDEFESEADNLFYMTNAKRDWLDATPQLAARVLRNFAETGKVDWDI